MKVSTHVHEKDQVKRVKDYGYPLVQDALREVKQTLISELETDCPEKSIAVALRDWSGKAIHKTGHSTGTDLVAIVRRGVVHTFLNADNLHTDALNVTRLIFAP
jgi:hypothetical protein